MLEIDNINLSYGDIQVLYDVCLKVPDGSITALVGSNGAGKTSLLKTISGLLNPASGDMTFLGKRINGLPPHHIVEMGIAHIPEGRLLFSGMSVIENLEMGAYTKSARKKKKESLEQVFSLFPILRERQKQRAGTLSGGEQQMLAIGRALMLRPKLLMLDEPSLGLAPKLVLKVFETVKTLNELGITVLLVEQNVYHALKLAYQAYVLETGKIVLQGEGKELLKHDHVKKAYMGI